MARGEPRDAGPAPHRERERRGRRAGPAGAGGRPAVVVPRVARRPDDRPGRRALSQGPPFRRPGPSRVGLRWRA
ncbi:hypothetical protein FRIGORI9N_360088 [Frigoribacterium sp. 9N]|nr:hypothetical protein FRIGORI9N_360088 [Frigoribacterium sp. 9N]